LQEGIHLADNALTVMTNHQDDALVQKMAKYVLGTDDFDNKFARAKGGLRNAFEIVERVGRLNMIL
jgi:hypothetical protein